MRSAVSAVVFTFDRVRTVLLALSFIILHQDGAGCDRLGACPLALRRQALQRVGKPAQIVTRLGAPLR